MIRAHRYAYATIEKTRYFYRRRPPTKRCVHAERQPGRTADRSDLRDFDGWDYFIYENGPDLAKAITLPLRQP
jgi:hypothetical protein